MTRALAALHDGTYGGVYYSANIDFGNSGFNPTWTKYATTGLANTLIKVMQNDVFAPYDDIYIQLDNNDIYHWNGASWDKIMDAATAAALTGGSDAYGYVAVDTLTPGTIYFPCQKAVTWLKVLKSVDYGANWTVHLVINTTITGSPYVTAHGDNVIVTSARPGAVAYFSTDGGTIWVSGGAGRTSVPQRQDPHNPGNYYDPTSNVDKDLSIYSVSGTSQLQNGLFLATAYDVSNGSVHIFDYNVPGYQRLLLPAAGTLKLYITNDYWATCSTPATWNDYGGYLVNMKTMAAAIENSDFMLIGGGSSGSAGVCRVYAKNGNDATVPWVVSGANYAAAPYTDSIPTPANSYIAYGGLWVGEAPASVGVYVYANELGDITDVPTYTGLGRPMFGDRSSYRDRPVDGFDIYHAEDVRRVQPQIHAPWDDTSPPPAGYGIVSNGSWWEVSDSIMTTMSDLNCWNVKDYGAVGDGVTDDTAAIQLTIDTATAAGTQSACICFPPGTYLIGGALQDTGAFNGQILLPNVSTSDAQITITFKGSARVPHHMYGALPAPAGYAILKSSLTGASGTAAVISGGNGAFPVKNNISVVVQDLICLSPDNPTMSWWNLTTTQGGAIRDVVITVVPWTTCSQPTNSNSYGIKLPQWGQSNYTYVDGIHVGGHYVGCLQGELTVLRGYIVGLCIVGIEIPSSQHASLIVDMQQTACTYGIRNTGGAHYLDVLQYDAEHYVAPAWAVTVYDLDDASNYFHGHIHWMGVAVGGVIDHSFIINGGANAITHEIGSPEILLDADAATVLDVTKDTIGLDVQNANTVFAGPTTGAANEPTFRALIEDDLPVITSIDLPYGSFSSSATQTIASATTAYAITYTDVEASNQITNSDDSKINILVAGLYLITFSAIGASSAPNKYLDIWLSVDGTNVPRTNTHSEFVGTHNERIITVTFLYEFEAGQYFELYMHSDDTGATLVATAAGINPTRPASPSIIITVNKVSDSITTSSLLLETGDRVLLETGDILLLE